MIEIRPLRRADYAKARRFAIDGMHLNWILSDRLLLDLYARYFGDTVLNRATHIYGAYVQGRFAGALLAEMQNRPRRAYSPLRAAYVRLFDWVQHLAAGGSAGAYEAANRAMYRDLCKRHTPDGEILFLAADPEGQTKGVGTALLHALEADEPGRLIYLYTDNKCNYPFYERRGFERAGERAVTLEMGKKTVPLQCLLYAKTAPGGCGALAPEGRRSRLSGISTHPKGRIL